MIAARPFALDDLAGQKSLPHRSIAMVTLLAVLGAAGASAIFAVNPWPALGMRTRNAAGLVVATLIAVALWLSGVTAIWIFPAAWGGALLLLWASQYEVGEDDLIWVRAAAATALVVLLAQFFR
jgi:hypothetical protein